MSENGNARDIVIILDIPIDRIDLSGVLTYCRKWLESDGGHQIATVNPEFIMTSQSNAEFAKALQDSDLNIADGIGLLYVSRMLHGGEKKLSRVTGVELSEKLSELCADMEKKIYLIGGDY